MTIGRAMATVAMPSRQPVLVELLRLPLIGDYAEQRAGFDWAVAASWLDAPVERVATVEVPIPYVKQLEDAALPQPARIVAAALRAVGR